MERKEQKSLKEINKAIQENIHLLPDEYQQQIQSSVDDLDKVAADYEQMMKGLPKLLLFLFALIVLLLALFGSFAHYSVQLEKNIDEKNNIIRRYQYYDSIYSMLLEKNDSTEYVYYRIRNGKPITYHELERQYDDLQKKYYALQQENANNQDILELLQQLYPYKVTESNGTLTVSGLNYKSQISGANAKIDSLERLNKKTYNNYDIVKLKLELILKNYPILVMQDSNRYYIEAPKIDSALMLLPYYRDKLTYDTITKKWSIVYTHKEVVTESKTLRKKK